MERFLHLVLAEVCDEETHDAIFRQILAPILTETEIKLKVMTKELLKRRGEGHPITYNPLFTEGLQSARNERMRQKYTQVIKGYLGTSTSARVAYTNANVDIESMVFSLIDISELNMDHFAASEALDSMNAYYKV